MKQALAHTHILTHTPFDGDRHSVLLTHVLPFHFTLHLSTVSESGHSWRGDRLPISRWWALPTKRAHPSAPREAGRKMCRAPPVTGGELSVPRSACVRGHRSAVHVTFFHAWTFLFRVSRRRVGRQIRKAASAQPQARQCCPSKAAPASPSRLRRSCSDCLERG